jgi:hypothetical protein
VVSSQVHSGRDADETGQAFNGTSRGMAILAMSIHGQDACGTSGDRGFNFYIAHL